MDQSTQKHWTKQLLAAVGEIDRPGEFCTSGVRPAILPGLEVEGVGSIGLPLSKEQAKDLKQHCEQAAYGKGEKTVVDTNVRRVWRLKPDRFKLTNPAWQTTLSSIVDSVKKELGLEDQGLEPHLYDLLLYEKGGFFLPHRDGEKLDRMVATLVIVLPSDYAGGELVVRHEDQERVIDFAGKDKQFQINYAAFYADCEHEVKPLTAGHRLCLVYNLTLSKAKAVTGAPQSRRHVEPIAAILASWATSNEEPQKVALTLEHHYSQEGLKWDALKGIDAARARILADAAMVAQCHAYLALLTFWESGSSEDDGYSPGGRRSRYDDYEDDEEDEDNDDDEEEGESGGIEGRYTMEEVFDESLTASLWSSPDGQTMAFGELPIEEDEILPKGSLKKVKPKEEFEGYTGNEGMTLERWYRRAAIVMWPDARHFDVLTKGHAKQALPALTPIIAAAREARGEKASALTERCRKFAQAILSNWEKTTPSYWDLLSKKDSSQDADLLNALDFLDDSKLVGLYLRDTLVKDPMIEPGEAIAKILSRLGWLNFRDDLLTLFRATEANSLSRNVRLLDRLCQAASGLPKKSNQTEARGVCLSVTKAVVDIAIQLDARKKEDHWHDDEKTAARRLAGLVRALLAIESDDLLAQVFKHLADHPRANPLRDVQMPALTELAGWLAENPHYSAAGLSPWIENCRQKLEDLTAAIPQPPKDFRRNAAVKCTCEYCAQLNKFLADPTAQQFAFKAAEQTRKHISSSIESAQSEVDRKTDKQSRPYALVCTKNTARYDRLLKEYHENLKHLETLRSIHVAQ